MRLTTRTSALPALGLALALTLTACGDGANDDATTPAGSAPAATTDADDTSDDGTTDATTSDDDAADATSDDDADDTTDADDDTSSATDGATAGGLTVAVEGEGVKLLRLSGDDDADDDDADDDATSDTDDDQRLEGKLISGPGGCLALQPGGQPQLLIFGDDADLAQSPPTVTVDGTDYKVGEEFAVEAEQVMLADVEGVPEQCSQGAAEQAWLVDG